MKSSNLHDLWVVMKFTMRDLVGRKAFRISTIIILAMIVFGFNVPRVMENLNGDKTTDEIILSDPENLYEGALELLTQTNETSTTENDEKNFAPKFVVSTQSLDEIKTKVNDGDAPYAIIISRDANAALNLQFIVKNTATSYINPTETMQILRNLYTNVQLQKIGLSPAMLAEISPQFNFEITQTEDQKVGGNIFAMMMLCMVLFFAIYFCAYQVSASITVEKTSKIMETLVTSTSPKIIVLGKTFGVGIVGLAQISLFALVAFFSAREFLDPAMLNNLLDLSTFTPFLIAVALGYFVLGYFVYALLYALTGSTISKPEDIQSANMPVALTSTVGFYLAYFSMMEPTSAFNSIAAFLPISSPFCMPMRVMMGLASVPEVLLSLAILIVTCILIAHIAIKIYSNAILHYGAKVKIKDLLKK